MKTEDLKTEFEGVKRLLRSREVAAKRQAGFGVSNMPHCLWMAEHALDKLIPNNELDTAHLFLGFCIRGLIGFGTFDKKQIQDACPSMGIIS